MKNKTRLLYGIVGLVLQLFLGMIYAWSIFIKPLEAEFGWLRSQTSLIFTISMIFFCVGNLAAGSITPKTSPRVSIMIAAVTIGAGFIGSSFTTTLPWIYVSYGVFCGFAVGIGANTILSTTLKWFVDIQGIASGILLMGFGFGSMALSPFVSMLLNGIGWRKTFMGLGVLFAALLLMGSMIIKNPPKEFSDSLLEKAKKSNKISSKDFTAKEMIKTSSFWIFFAWIVLISAGSLALISNAVPAASDILLHSMEESAAIMAATAAMGMISTFNGLGRFAFGIIWDKKGYKVSLMVLSVAYGLAMIVCALATSRLSVPLLVAGFIILGMTYGGSMSSTSAMIASFFGTKYYSINYACATCQMIISASIGPVLFGSLRTNGSMSIL